MYSTVTSKLFHVATALRRQRSPLRVFAILLARSCVRRTYSTERIGVMASRLFKGQVNQYNGVTIDSNEESCGLDAFTQRLESSMKQWAKEKRRTIWFRIHIPHAGWVPVLAKEGFKFHHAKEEYVMMYRWQSHGEECNVPPYAHTNLGIGAFVFNEKTEEILVIKEKYSGGSPLWKLPGGYVEPDESLENAVKREVLEETGIQTVFKSLITFRHGHGYAFGCSDIYMVAYLSPVTFDIQKCEKEISECQWMKLKDYSEHPQVHKSNQEFAKKMLEFLLHRMGISMDHAIHPITKKPMCVYSIGNIPSEQSAAK